MLSAEMVKSLNGQMNRELYSAYLYMSMAAWAAHENLKGFANWFGIQTKEELIHAEKFYNYIIEQGGRAVMDAIEAPPEDFSSGADLFEKTLAHEKIVTGLVNDLVAQARKENDFATEGFLQWFVTEQIEEEATPAEILGKLKLVGKDGRGILMIDSELATRVFVPPATAAE